MPGNFHRKARSRLGLDIETSPEHAGAQTGRVVAVRMLPGVLFVLVGLCVAVETSARNSSLGGWLNPQWDKPRITDANRKPAPAAQHCRNVGPGRRTRRGNAGAGRARETEQRQTRESAARIRPFGLERTGRTRRSRASTPCSLGGQRPEESLRAAGDAALEPLQRQADADLPGRLQDRDSLPLRQPLAHHLDGRPSAPKLVDGGVEIGGEVRSADSSATRSAGGWTTPRSKCRRSA